jgi:hypothetical protein
MKLQRTLQMTILGLSLMIGVSQVYGADEKGADKNIQEEMSKFSEDNSKLRENHIKEMRELHLKHVNEMYDRKLANNKEISELLKSVKPGDKAGRAEIREKIKATNKTFKNEEKIFSDDFKENILKKNNQEFRDSMKVHFKNLKNKHKE